MFKTEGRVDKQFYGRIGRYFYTPKSRIIRAVYIVCALIFAVLAYFRHIYSVSILVLICAAVIFLEAYITKKWYIKDLFKSLKETSGVDAALFIVTLEDDGVKVANKISGAEDRFEYPSFIKFASTGSEILLFTKSWQMVPIFKTELTETEQGELIDFLKAKCTAIKKWKNGKVF